MIAAFDDPLELLGSLLLVLLMFSTQLLPVLWKMSSPVRIALRWLKSPLLKVPGIRPWILPQDVCGEWLFGQGKRLTNTAFLTQSKMNAEVQCAFQICVVPSTFPILNPLLVHQFL